MNKVLDAKIDTMFHQDIAVLRQALDEQGYVATDENILIAWTVYSETYHNCEWYRWEGELTAEDLVGRLMIFMTPKPVEADSNTAAGIRELEEELTKAVRGIMTGMEWNVDIDDLGDELFITAWVGEKGRVLDDPRSKVIWTFSKDRLTAQITLPNPPNYMELVAHFMAGNLLGQGLTEEWSKPQGVRERALRDAAGVSCAWCGQGFPVSKNIYYDKSFTYIHLGAAGGWQECEAGAIQELIEREKEGGAE